MRIQAAMITLFLARLYTQHLMWFKNGFVKKNEGQHYLNGVPEQAGWLQGLLSNDTDYQDIEAVSAPWVEVDSPVYSRQGECGGGFGISLHIYKELVKAVLSSFSSYLTDMGSSFHGLICSLADPPSPNFCFMETRPKGNILAQDLARVHSDNSSSINLAKCMVVPIAPPDEYRSPSPLDIPGHNSGFPKTSWLLKNPQWRLGVYRVSSVGFKIQDSMQSQLISSCLETIKNYHTAALKLHRDPTSLRTHKDIHSLFACLAKMAILTQQHKTHMDLTPTLSFLASIPSLASTSLAALAWKTVFLLAMAAFLRPSDLNCLQLTSAYLQTNTGALVFDLHAPKECRRD
ncbi:hypothetical protein PHYBLDRAFT_58443 [Phycomyces blakesleeanus NRRL 1555(-)]|uniref:Uncharacterized protein n=1 Tax=Phycomyces blakesleeanus (strain ATCC 8743b / DSM 1359 / FGSC 10004 / NBRC 33097 / NRRL 1555) TaxID=763407 RepID=A0A162V1N3_PHYB8|nr:hypothetical protein PHYBLDRAFT_58443 [Phycomyces blakesleeanus NRRL 1555(-)]OAD79393.1 hypothetical protein PHYBLDRAFT_58443 [Phycomyces blakesleeanus NRRL 1555(-)]|eukprot:XP_018297433.1 hypothetical protein PHYBLDRAFT_58443 [Phycomyces blakesleeanus NRRL 1555(-)]